MLQSLCESCDHLREVVSAKGSRFLLCENSFRNAGFPKYPPQPVIRCVGYQQVVRAAVRPIHTAESSTPTTQIDQVRLRPVVADDLPLMYAMQLDPESNRMAVTNPRSREVFDTHWSATLADSKNTARAILIGDQFAGYISCFPMDNQDHVGYWIGRAYWGMGIASRALQLLLHEVTQRPLVTTIAKSNVASLRVLQKSGFIVERVYLAPASERYTECEVAELVLA